MGHHWQVNGNKYKFVCKEIKRIEQSVGADYLAVLISAIEEQLESGSGLIDVSDVNKDYKGSVAVVLTEGKEQGVLIAGFGKQSDTQMIVDISCEYFWFKKN